MKLFLGTVFVSVNAVFIFFIISNNNLFTYLITISLSGLMTWSYSFAWLPAVWANETHLTSSFFGSKRTHNYADITEISKANYSVHRILPHEAIVPARVTFRSRKTLTFFPSKDGLSYLFKVVKNKSLSIRIEGYDEQELLET